MEVRLRGSLFLPRPRRKDVGCHRSTNAAPDGRYGEAKEGTDHGADEASKSGPPRREDGTRASAPAGLVGIDEVTDVLGRSLHLVRRPERLLFIRRLEAGQRLAPGPHVTWF